MQFCYFICFLTNHFSVTIQLNDADYQENFGEFSNIFHRGVFEGELSRFQTLAYKVYMVAAPQDAHVAVVRPLYDMKQHTLIC